MSTARDDKSNAEQRRQKMGKKNENRIPATYWENGTGANLYDRMHHDGQEALDMLLSVEDGLNTAVANETDEAVRQELEKARKQIRTSLRAFRRGFYGLNREGF